MGRSWEFSGRPSRIATAPTATATSESGDTEESFLRRDSLMDAGRCATAVVEVVPGRSPRVNSGREEGVKVVELVRKELDEAFEELEDLEESGVAW